MFISAHAALGAIYLVDFLSIGILLAIRAIGVITICNLLVWFQYELLDEKSEEKLEVLREITGTLMHRKHLDSSVDFIGKLLFGIENGPSKLAAVRSPGQPLVDDWDCLKRMVS